MAFGSRPGWTVLAFCPATALVLWADSEYVARHLAHGQWLSNILTLCYLSVLVRQMRPDRKLLAVLFVPLSAVGECVFALLLQLYHYRLTAIPVYVPLGHAVILSAGIGITELRWVACRSHVLRRALIAFHVLVILAAFLLGGDTFSLLLGAAFAIALLRSSESNLVYLIIGVLVLYVEVLGTFWGCWKWHRDIFSILHTCNPPPGAFVCYVIAEVGAIRVARRVELLARRRKGIVAPATEPLA